MRVFRISSRDLYSGRTDSKVKERRRREAKVLQSQMLSHVWLDDEMKASLVRSLFPGVTEA